ncbi:hypothetical protein N7491_002753 [Penicillium cf. griseofulvum]|uniref:Uncharacterized protein n=1 Tax=Penicillium cf. griseofulvum TaxID=2972120 RepID=A0A9W9MSN8_9EURO|nr:hypothetical protein N7472_003080 [Penicillium cf. griseofulvum]KAJ5440347.1 hypothetical protein N7491_002753 [Penicillium cf. griseofulvum]KAJ5448395.1 hypothetical protein N7445_003216 [Penicillium cf. griseofulvum]
MWSAHESLLKSNSPLPASSNAWARVDFKDGLFHVFIYFSGTGGPQVAIFAIDCDEEKGVHMLVFVSKMILDISNRTVVRDAVVLPLRTDLIPKNHPCVQSNDEQQSFSQFHPHLQRRALSLEEAFPACTERCRSWQHKPN